MSRNSTPSIFTKIIPVLGCLWLLLSSAAYAQETWKIVRYDDRDYVTLNSIRAFIGKNTIKRSGEKVSVEFIKPGKKQNIFWDLTINNQECYLNDVKFVLTYSVISCDGEVCISKMDLVKLIDPILRPAYIANAGNFRTVIIDPGHGGDDSGASNSYGQEKDYNLKVALSVKKLLERYKYRVVLTRDDDHYLTLQQRVELANAVKESAIFISIHFNSGGGNSAHGIETFTLSPTGVAHYGSEVKASDQLERNGNAHDSANVALATAVHSWVIQELRGNAKPSTDSKSTNNSFIAADRGIKRARYNVLSGVTHPAVLIEGGFMSHPYEARLIANPAYQEIVANGICRAIGKYQQAVSKTPVMKNPPR